jgi:glyceraldehyde-3-phosphate dehydrogenase (NADP+)
VQAFVRSGVPKGVLSCVTGGGSEVGDVLVRHPDISMIALTGSTATGKHIASVVGMKPLLFELGGNNPVLVLDSADKPFTAKELVKGAFSYAGQRCTAIKYVLAYRSVIDDIIDHIHPLLADMVKKGDPRDSQTKLVGPVISATSAQSIKQRIDDAVNQGAVVVAGGSVQGNYVEPTILKNVRPDMEIIRTETFGPVLSFVEIQSVEEAVNIINASSYGLQVSIFTKDEQAGMTIAQQINVGTVQINSSPQRGPDHFPFMGIKDSGLGVQGVQYSLEAMSRLKSVVLNKMI